MAARGHPGDGLPRYDRAEWRGMGSDEMHRGLSQVSRTAGARAGFSGENHQG